MTIQNQGQNREIYVDWNATFTVALTGEDAGGMSEVKLYQDNVELDSRTGDRSSAVDTLRIHRNISFTRAKGDHYRLRATAMDYSGNTSSTPEIIVRAAAWPLDMDITSLSIRIVTANDSGAGTDDYVYFDIGPLSWVLNRASRNTGPYPAGHVTRRRRGYDHFERGADDIYNLPLPSRIVLTTNDIVWLRLHKKGSGGVTGTPDGPGREWLPERMQLIINGTPQFTISNNNMWLKLNNPTWEVHASPFYPANVEERFVRSIRIRENLRLPPGAEYLAQFTTPIKHMGISGWIRRGLPLTCGTGTVYRTPAMSTDGLATIDLRLESIIVGDGNSPYRLDGSEGISHTRYIRVEYEHNGNPVPQDYDRVEICGRVKWDTDFEGWYEIHPRSSRDVHFLP